jgi:hypothetical protein
MKKLRILGVVVAAMATIGLGGCVVAPAPYAYAPGYGYAPGYYAPSVSVGVGYYGGGGCCWGGHGGWHR